MKNIIIMAESGSDLTTQLANQYGIEIVPMHVTFENESLDDGSFKVEKIVEYYEKTGKLPKTSGSTPEDFTQAFNVCYEKGKYLIIALTDMDDDMKYIKDVKSLVLILID